MVSPLCIGIATRDDEVQVATKRSGQHFSLRNFRGEAGRVALISYLSGFREPVKLAIHASLAGLSLALLLSAANGREIYLVSSAIPNQPVALVAYAELAL